MAALQSAAPAQHHSRTPSSTRVVGLILERIMPLSQASGAITVPLFGREPSASRAHFRESLAQLAVISLVVLSIFSPPALMWDPNSFYLKWEVALLPLIFVTYGWLLLAGIVRKIQFNGMFVVGAVYTVAVALSIWYGSAMLGQAMVLRDFYEFPKLWLPVAFFTLAYEAHLSEAGLRRLLSFFAATLLFMCLYAWGQWAGLGYGNCLDNIYVAPEHSQRGLLYARRVYSTLGNPNLLGMLMTWSAAAFLLAAMLRVDRQARNIGMFLACVVTLVMTGSRYGLLTAAFAILLVAASSFASGRTRWSRLVVPLALLTLFASAIFLVSSANQRTLERLQTLQAPTETDSFRGRVDRLWLDALDSFSQSPILGRGPAKTVFEGIVTDSEYLDVLKKFGLLGFVAYLAYFLFPLFLI